MCKSHPGGNLDYHNKYHPIKPVVFILYATFSAGNHSNQAAVAIFLLGAL